MVIAADSNQFAKGSHYESNLRKHNALKKMGHEVIKLPLPVADYVLVNPEIEEIIQRAKKRNTAVKKMDLLGTYSIAVDTKKSLVEVAGNICSKSHERTADDLLRAKKHGIQIFWLIENNEGVENLRDLFAKGKTPVCEHGWKNIKGEHKWVVTYTTKVPCITLAKSLYRMETEGKYPIKFIFCKPKDAASKIVEILTGGGQYG